MYTKEECEKRAPIRTAVVSRLPTKTIWMVILAALRKETYGWVRWSSFYDVHEGEVSEEEPGEANTR